VGVGICFFGVYVSVQLDLGMGGGEDDSVVANAIQFSPAKLTRSVTKIPRQITPVLRVLSPLRELPEGHLLFSSIDLERGVSTSTFCCMAGWWRVIPVGCE